MPPKRLPKAIKPEEFKLLVKITPEKDRRSRVAFLLAYGSGLRISEVVKLTKADVYENHIEIWGGKGKVDRTVPVPKGWRDWMKSILPLERSIRTLERNFKKYADKVSLPDNYSFHSLRHGFATRLIESGVPITHIQILLGHSNVSTTGIYTKARPTDALKSYEDLF